MSSDGQRIAVVSDSHGKLPAHDAAIAEIDADGIDGGVNRGDLVGGPLCPADRQGRGDWAHALRTGRLEREVLGR